MAHTSIPSSAKFYCRRGHYAGRVCGDDAFSFYAGSYNPSVCLRQPPPFTQGRLWLCDAANKAERTKENLLCISQGFSVFLCCTSAQRKPKQTNACGEARPLWDDTVKLAGLSLPQPRVRSAAPSSEGAKKACCMLLRFSFWR